KAVATSTQISPGRRGGRPPVRAASPASDERDGSATDPAVRDSSVIYPSALVQAGEEVVLPAVLAHDARPAPAPHQLEVLVGELGRLDGEREQPLGEVDLAAVRGERGHLRRVVLPAVDLAGDLGIGDTGHLGLD